METTTKDRLTELLDDLGAIVNVPDNVDDDGCGTYTIEGGDYIADYLIANGVTLPPVPIGSIVYEIRARGKRRALCGYRKCDYGIATTLMFKNAISQKLELYVKEKPFTKADSVRLNKTIFKTKEEAEKALKEKENGN